MQGQTLSIDPTEARRRLDSWDAAESLLEGKSEPVCDCVAADGLEW